MGQYYAAVADYTTALKQQPDSAEVLYHRARVFIDLKQNKDAIADLKRVLSIKPDFAEAKAELESINKTARTSR